jgi:nitrite reductase (NAD(P)H)
VFNLFRRTPTDSVFLLVEMADILSFNLTQTVTETGVTFKPRKMNPPDLSTKLKLMGVDVGLQNDAMILLTNKRLLHTEISSPKSDIMNENKH